MNLIRTILNYMLVSAFLLFALNGERGCAYTQAFLKHTHNHSHDPEKQGHEHTHEESSEKESKSLAVINCFQFMELSPLLSALNFLQFPQKLFSLEKTARIFRPPISA